MRNCRKLLILRWLVRIISWSRHQPQWFPKLASAIETIELSLSPVFDRAGIETLLCISRRSAIRLLNDWGGYQVGKTFLIGRDDLLEALRAVQIGENYLRESRRRERLDAHLDNARSYLRSRQVKLPVPAQQGYGAAALPPGIEVTAAGFLAVQFSTAKDLFGRLYELVQTAAQDLDRFEMLLQVHPK